MTVETGGDKLAFYLKELRMRVGEAKFASWFVDLGLAEHNRESVVLTTPSQTKRDIIDNRYLPMMVNLWREKISPVSSMTLLVSKNAFAQSAKAEPIGAKPSTAKSTSVDDAEIDFVAALQAALEPRRRFSTLAIGDANRVGEAAIRQSLAPGRSRDLVYVYGETSLGKTHLIQAACHYIQESCAGAYLYVSARKFTEACVKAIFTKKLPEFYAAFEAHDYIAIDDIHRLIGKDRTQEELLTVVDALLDMGKQVVLVGDAPPKALAQRGMNSRLTARLDGGLCAALSQPSPEHAAEILRKRIAFSKAKCKISDEALSFVAHEFCDAPRALTGALSEILLRYEKEEVCVGLEETRVLLESRLEDRGGVTEVSDLIAIGAEACGLTTQEVLGRAQQQRYVRARHAISYCAREYLGESFPRIGRALRRDHTTVMSSFRRAEDLLKRERAFQQVVSRIRLAIRK